MVKIDQNPSISLYTVGIYQDISNADVPMQDSCDLVKIAMS
jgi:hypothetical protein